MPEPVIDIHGELIPMPEDVRELTPETDTPMGATLPRIRPGIVRLGARQGQAICGDGPPVICDALDFVVSKRTEGANCTSPGAAQRKAAILAAGKVYGEYHRALPGDGAQQADFFLAVAGMPADDQLPVWLDLEISGLGPAFRDAFCNRYRQRVGVSPGLYTDLPTWRSQLGRRLGAASRLWLADYGVSSPGEKCDIWQYQGGPGFDTAYTALQSMTVGANRKPPMPLVGYFDVFGHTYPYGPNPKDPYGNIGFRPMTSVAYRTHSGDTWTSILHSRYPGMIYGEITTNVSALKRWHRTHGGDPHYTGYYTFDVGAVVVLPKTSPGKW